MKIPTTSTTKDLIVLSCGIPIPPLRWELDDCSSDIESFNSSDDMSPKLSWYDLDDDDDDLQETCFELEGIPPQKLRDDITHSSKPPDSYLIDVDTLDLVAVDTKPIAPTYPYFDTLNMTNPSVSTSLKLHCDWSPALFPQQKRTSQLKKDKSHGPNKTCRRRYTEAPFYEDQIALVSLRLNLWVTSTTGHYTSHYITDADIIKEKIDSFLNDFSTPNQPLKTQEIFSKVFSPTNKVTCLLMEPKNYEWRLYVEKCQIHSSFTYKNIILVTSSTRDNILSWLGAGAPARGSRAPTAVG
jgi:hypothetical protein